MTPGELAKRIERGEEWRISEMTEAEKLAQRLEERQSETVDGNLLARPADYDALEAAALIRSQEAKIKRMAEALRDAGVSP